MKLYEEYLNGINKDSISADDVKHSARWAVYGKALTIGIPLVIKLTKMAFSKAERECARFKGPGVKRCVLESEIRINTEKINKLRSMIQHCSNDKNPDGCRKKIDFEIRLANLNINDARKNLEAYKRELNEGISVELAKIGMGIIFSQVVDKGLFIAWRSTEALFDQAVKRCGVYGNSAARSMCISKIHLASYERKLQILNRILTTCHKQKNPEGCNKKISDKINVIKQKITIERDNIVLYNKAAVKASSINLSRR